MVQKLVPGVDSHGSNTASLNNFEEIQSVFLVVEKSNFAGNRDRKVPHESAAHTHTHTQIIHSFTH